MYASIPLLLLFTFLISSILSFIFLRRNHTQDHRRHPPGPPPFPIIGNLHLLGKLPHRTLQALAQQYGPIMSLRLGQVPTVVVSSSESVQHFLKSHDVVFASRPILEASKYFGYGSKGLVFSEYGPYWRHMRKVCTLQLLSASKVESFAPLRKRELELTVKSVQERAARGEVLDLSMVVHDVVEDIVYKMVLGCSKHDEFDLKGLIQNGMNITGAFNLADYVPWLGSLDLQGLNRSYKKISTALDQVLEKIIKEHEDGSNAQNEQQHKDFVVILLSLMYQPMDPYDEQSHVIDRTNIKAILLDMISGAFETSATVVEWTLSVLGNSGICSLLCEPQNGHYAEA